MGQPTPPGDIPLFEGLGSEWNDVVGAIPEDRRAELAPRIKERLSSTDSLKPWAEFSSSGITPEQATTAINLQRYIENNPREIYDTIGKYLGISPQQAQQVVEEIQDETDAGNDDPRIAQMQNQLDTLAQIALAQRQEGLQAQQNAEADKWLDNELSGLKKKYGDVNEREIIMRMAHLDMSAEQAYEDYTGMITEARRTRPAPMILGNGGAVPRNAIDPTKLSSADTKNVVAQMLQAANNESRS